MPDVKAKRSKKLSRMKREWILPPARLQEGFNYTDREFIAKVIKMQVAPWKCPGGLVVLPNWDHFLFQQYAYPYWIYTKNQIFFHQIRSDMDTEDRLEYSLVGEGADKPPFNLFIVNPDNGFVRITGILDREKKDCYNVRLL